MLHHFTVSSREDLLALVPYLVGYEPDESLLVMTHCCGSVVQSSCICRSLCDEPGSLAPIVESMRAAAPGAEFIAIGYGPPEWADGAVMAVRELLHPSELLCCLVVSGGLFWDVGLGEVPGLSAGHEFDPSISPAAAQAVASGMAAYASRDELVRLVAGPGELQPAEAAAWEQACDCLEWQPGRQRAFVDDCLEDAVSRGARLDRGRLRRLCVLVDGAVHRHAVALTGAGAGDPAALEQLWADAVAIAPERWAPAVLGLLGIASWRRGGGALLSEAIVRLDRLEPASGMLLLLNELRVRRPPVASAGPGCR